MENAEKLVKKHYPEAICTFFPNEFGKRFMVHVWGKPVTGSYDLCYSSTEAWEKAAESIKNRKN